MLYRSILLPIDVAKPEAAPQMFEKARALLAPDGKLSVAYVVPDVPNFVLVEMPDGFLPTTIRKSERILRDLVEEAGIDAEVHVLTGPPADAILGAADTGEMDLVIIASHHPGLADYFLGSTAARVVRHAKCSVLVIR
jgi:nucleotide-binding universal stress UspA family protein